MRVQNPILLTSTNTVFWKAYIPHRYLLIEVDGLVIIISHVVMNT